MSDELLLKAQKHLCSFPIENKLEDLLRYAFLAGKLAAEIDQYFFNQRPDLSVDELMKKKNEEKIERME